jgi:hypothetical protein
LLPFPGKALYKVFILISVAADDIKSCDEFLKFTV